jgi:bacillithiol system protein YtxJ
MGVAYKLTMEWNKITADEQVQEADTASYHQAVLIYKHSSRCGICSTALSRIERKFGGRDASKLKPYFVDVLGNRDVSQAIAQKYGVEHASPQALVISKGKCVLVQNHMEISYDDLMAAA